MRRQIVILAALAFFVAAPASAATRHCDATYLWETTGGSLGPVPFGEFRARGGCGNNVPNRCRIRARQAAESCIKTQWERRWEHHPIHSDGTQDVGFDRNSPEACTQGNNVLDYDLTTVCATERKDGLNANRVCHSEAHPSNIAERKTVATKGDIKSALETEVCCKFRDGLHEFKNERDVHVRLLARISGNKNCPKNLALSSDYKINCKRVRETICN